MSRRAIIFTVLIVSVLLVVGGGLFGVKRYYDSNLGPVSSSQNPVEVTIPSGSTLHDISVLLKQKGLIRNQRVFERYVQTKGYQSKLQAGTYSLLPSQSVGEIVDVLARGHIQKNLFTILPGQRIDQIKSAMINTGFSSAEVEQAFNPGLYAGHPALANKPVEASLEGYLYPESFQKITTTTPQAIIRQSLDEMYKHLTADIQAGFAPQGLSVHQAITLASIIEREVSHPEDRKTVAQVFLKRIKTGKKLESDATASYGAILAGQSPSSRFDSTYNTYSHLGLPPGPISNVSQVSLQAVAQPSATDWLYFVSGDDGKTHFSRTLEEHEAAISQYCKKLCNQ